MTRMRGRVGPVAVIVLAVACLVTGTASATPVPDKQTQADQLAQGFFFAAPVPASALDPFSAGFRW